MENFIESLYVPYQNSAVKAVVKDKIMFSVPMGTVSVPGLVTFYPDDFSVIGGQVRISSKQIDAKLDKVVTTATTGRVYAVSPSGENYMQPFSSSSVSDSLVARDSDGNILLPDRQDGDNLAISRKTGDGRYVAKKPHTTGKTEVYIQTDSGIGTKEVGDTAGDVPVRNVNGNITGYSPLTDNEYTTKSYVNSSIANEAADYISNNGEPFTSLEELQEYTKTHTVTNNDYAIIVVTDNDGNTRYDRYKYNESTGVWGFEYSINNSSFTEAQWAAINSGLTSAKLATMLTEIDNLMAQSLMSVDEAVVPYGESTVTYDTTDGMILHGALAVKTNDGNYWNIPLTFSLPVVAGDGLVVDIKPDNKKMTIKIDYEKVMKMPALDDQNSELAVAVGKWTSGTSSTKVPDAIQWRDCQKNVNNNAIVQRTETGNVLLPDGFPADVGNGIDQYGNSIDNMATPKSYVDNAVANAGSKQTVVRIKTSNMFDGSITDTKITGTLDADTLSAIQGDNVVINFVFSNNSGGDSVNVCFGRDKAKEMSTDFAYFGDVIPVNSGTSGLPFSFALRVTLADGAWTLNYAQLYKSVEVDSKVSSATKNMQKTTNMVTSIGNSPSDTKYPSEKAVVDYFAKAASSVVSPTVETETIAGGTKVTITDKDGAHEFDVMNGVNGESAYQIATEHGYTGTETEWLASLHAANPKVLPMSQYATEAEAIAYMDSQTDHSIIYVWNNKVYCNASKTVTQLTGACLYGYRNSASSGIVAATGKSMYVIPVSSFAAPLAISDYTFPISDTPYIYGGTVIPTFNVALIRQDSWVGKTDAFDISAEQLQGCSYVVFAVTTSTQPSEVSVTVNGTVVPLSVITSPSQISEVIGTGTTTVDGYVDSGVIYTAIISSSSTKKYVNDRNAYILPVPSGYCESHATYEAGTNFLTKYPYATMTEMFSALATANSAYITETTLGKDQSNTYDIKSYILDAPSSLASGQTSAVSSEKPVFIITSGLHGLEPDAVHTVYHFMQDLAENYYESEQLQYLHDNVKFVIIPICNPWGYVNQNYHNSRDVDLNKNFECGYRTNGTANTGTAANSEAETLLMKQVFDAYPKAIFHLECHGKYGVDNAFSKTIWFSLMQTLHSELIELDANKLNNQIGRRLYKLGYETNHSTGGYITYYGLNGRPKDYTGTKYGILSGTMEGTGCIYGDTGYSVNTQKINCEALENFVLNVIDSLGSKVKVRNTDNEDTIASLDWYNGEVM